MCKRHKGGYDEPPSFEICAKVEAMMDIIDGELAQGGDEESNDTIAATTAMIRHGEVYDIEGAVLELAVRRVHEQGYAYDSEPTKDEWLAGHAPEKWERKEWEKEDDERYLRAEERLRKGEVEP